MNTFGFVGFIYPYSVIAHAMEADPIRTCQALRDWRPIWLVIAPPC